MTTHAQRSVSEKYEESHTGLMCAALEGQTKIVKTLLRTGADVNAKDSAGRTALMFAVINMHTDTVKMLLDHGADVNARADDGCTPLMLAACSGNTEIAQALLSQGADVGGKFTQTGKTAGMLAAEKGYTAIVELLKRVRIQNN